METIIRKAVQSMSANHTSREQWLNYAELVEKAGHIGTCQAIVRQCLSIDLEEADKKHTWIADAERCQGNGAIQTARAVYAVALSEFKTKKGLWLRAAHLEKKHGKTAELHTLLARAIRYCPQATVLWLMAAKEKWLADDVDGSRAVLEEAFKANPDSEAIWLAATKLESENGEVKRARMLLTKAREKAGTARIWMKAAKLERQEQHWENERELLLEATRRYGKPAQHEIGTNGMSVISKLWLMLLQWEKRHALQNADPEKPAARNQRLREWYTKAYKTVPECIAVWLAAADIEETVCEDLVKCRSLFEKARLANGDHPHLLIEMVRLEDRHGNGKLATMYMAQALQKNPASGEVWAEILEREPPVSRRQKSQLAIKTCDKDARVICAVAKLFWSERKFDKTRAWMNRAVALDSDNGDCWATFYRFEVQHGTEEQQEKLIKKVQEADPHHGVLWTKVSKSPEYCTVGGCRLPVEEILKKAALLVDLSNYNMT
eukprot:NODE_887_length_1577_cov_65.731724_g876_i0.p1 GENE.NODE_887_length_1577_cov_65.731724_g876_i0~~NODE_887_length_1577_cov_65.731724_g876_i0.p1  ORF type:complete len:515 (-),score=153.13 NODE_887_length_1577_cov_65.731724_g876_i0:33-1508(-)